MPAPPWDILSFHALPPGGQKHEAAIFDQFYLSPGGRLSAARGEKQPRTRIVETILCFEQKVRSMIKR